MPRSVGATPSKGDRSPGQRGCFSEGPERIVCECQKAQPAIREGNRNPVGLELPSAAAERGNCPAAKPNRKGLKGRRVCNSRNSTGLAKQLETLSAEGTTSSNRRKRGWKENVAEVFWADFRIAESGQAWAIRPNPVCIVGSRASWALVAASFRRLCCRRHYGSTRDRHLYLATGSDRISADWKENRPEYWRGTAGTHRKLFKTREWQNYASC